MKRNKNNKQNLTTILLAAIGLVFIVLYFFLATLSPTMQLLKPRVSKEKILSEAESFFHQLLSEPGQFQREVSTIIDAELLRYAQFHKKKNGTFPDMQVASWIISWKDKNASTAINRSSEAGTANIFEVTFDFNGKLLGFKILKKSLVLQDKSSISEDEAEMEAKYFLESVDIKTNSLITTNKELKSTNKSTTYQFTLKDKNNSFPHVTDTYSFEYLGNRIVSYRWNRVVDPEAGAIPKYKKESMISYILMAVTWLMIIGIVIVLFIRKLRKDELEFKRALWLGIAAAVLVFTRIAVSGGGRMEAFLQAGVSGLFVFLGLLILFPVTESISRETWPEKLKTLDLLFQGKVLVRETGTAILQSFFLTGLTAFLFAGLVYIVTAADAGYLLLPAAVIDNFLDFSHAAIFALKNIVAGLFLGFLFLGFWPGYIRGKIPGRGMLFFVISVITLNLTGLQHLYFHPPYLGFFLLLPLTTAWVYFIRKWDMLTVILALPGMLFFLGLQVTPLLPETLFSPQGTAVIVFMALFFLLGVYLVFRPYSAEDYDSYVPEYVSRIAEKERFLKELEIARGVQMRFLPQKLPEFPGLEIVSICQPAMEVGGDYYDFIQMDDRYMSILIGDVSGKGVSAAFYMTMVKGIIKTLSKKTKQPAVLLAEANDIFYENSARNVFVTIIYGIFDLKEKNLTIASAGHNPLIVWRNRTGKTTMINPKGIALGLEHGERYKDIIAEACIPIEEKDVFVFYTDGVSEAMNSDEEIFGEERLRSVIETYASQSARDLQEKILTAVKEFSGKASQHDDFTMVVVKVRPGEAKKG